MLNVRNLETRFRLPTGQTIGVHGVDLQLERGEFYTLLGPSGCGKTTTLRSVAGFEMPQAGEIQIGNDIVFSSDRNYVVPTHKRKLGMVFQSYAIWPHMTVFDNVAYPLRYGRGQKLSRTEIADRVKAVLSMVRLHEIENKLAPQLSGGQQQRVALARALIQKPQLLLLDEPLSNLDAALREVLRVEIRELLREMHITALYVTHDRLEALAMSDRVGVMKDGKIVQEGKPWDLYTAPDETFVAAFLGSINSLAGEVDVASGGPEVTVKTEIGTVRCSGSPRLLHGNKVTVIVRPERLTISKMNGGDDVEKRNLVGEIESLVFLGENFDCRVRVKNRLLRATLPWTDRFEVGEKVYLCAPVDAWNAVSH